MNLGRELYLREEKSEVFSFDANMASSQKNYEQTGAAGRDPKHLHTNQHNHISTRETVPPIF